MNLDSVALALLVILDIIGTFLGIVLATKQLKKMNKDKKSKSSKPKDKK